MASSKEEIIYNNLQSIEQWALAGISEKEIALMLDMAYSTFRDIKKKNSALSALLKKCADEKKKELGNQVRTVEASVYDRAKGYSYFEKVPIKVKESGYDENGKKYEREKVEIVEVEKRVPADFNFARLYLTNKAKADWKDNPHRVENDTKRLEIAKKQADISDGGRTETIEEFLNKIKNENEKDLG